MPKKQRPSTGAGGGRMSAGPTVNQGFGILHHNRIAIKPQPSETTDFSALRAVWLSLQAEEATASHGCRLGIARRRMELLSAFPSWRIPEILDVLNQPEPKEAFA